MFFIFKAKLAEWSELKTDFIVSQKKAELDGQPVFENDKKPHAEFN